MKKLFIILILASSLASCSKQEEQKQVIIYNNGPFQKMREQGERLSQDSEFMNSIKDLK